MGYIGPFREERIHVGKLSGWLVVVAFWASLVGCAQFQDTVGCYAHTDATLGYVHQFGDSTGGGLSGTLAPEHGNFGSSTFRYDQPDQFSENILKTELTVRFAPGSCK